MTRIFALGPILVSLTLFVVALFLPALQFESQPSVKGLTTLLWGWWGILSFDFPWLANLAYFIAVGQVLLGHRAAARKFVIAAIALGLLSLFVKNWYFSEAEATRVKSLGSGFYCWIASFVALVPLYLLPAVRD